MIISPRSVPRAIELKLGSNLSLLTTGIMSWEWLGPESGEEPTFAQVVELYKSKMSCQCSLLDALAPDNAPLMNPAQIERC